MLALGLVPLLGALGAAVDYSRGNSMRSAMQGALDSAALMLAKEGPGADPQKATTYFQALLSKTGIQNLDVTASVQPGMNGVSATLGASGSLRTLFLNVMGFQSLNLSVHSTAISVSDGLGCVLSLNATVSNAISSQGSAKTTLDGCAIYDNSANATALSNGGSATISTLFVGVVGGVGSTSGITATQGIRTGIGAVADPYADATFPAFSGCRDNKYTAKTVETIYPGVYCGGIGVNANAVLTLSAGIYYLDSGDFSVNGGGTVQGTGVTLVFTSKSGNNIGSATINGNANVNLTAPTSGDTRGIVIFGDRRIPTGTTFKFNGGASQYLGGAIYVPTGAIQFSGGIGSGTSCTQIIGDTVTFTGNSTVKIDCTHYETKPFSVKVLRLAS
jgi:hypothetical protein